MSTIQNLSHSPKPDNVEKLLNELPKACFWEAKEICQWEGFWFLTPLIEPAITFRSTFEARDDDVLLASTMKTGTTWLKALTLCIMQKRSHQNSHELDDILTTGNPHFHIPTIEGTIYATKTPPFDIYDASTPRLLHTHLSYAVLPDSIKNSACKIVYIARNPKDTLISMWHFFNSVFKPNQDPIPLEKALDIFCSGVHLYGPFFEHVVEYWQESQKRPQKILFIKYEELKSDPKQYVSKIAEFLGRPFADEKEVYEVLRRCRLERLKNMEVNKSESAFTIIQNKSFFRKGEVGDWKNYLTPEMEEQINQICRIKFEPFGLFL
ncbi:hypothetical protein DH2020_022272 [Rehmannia glutinosa]|uniref:Sulfotransferase n=1 Tax=Rehmannia glutinosa TaxID=99300 RepID=A0ABR0WGN9_REHGL